MATAVAAAASPPGSRPASSAAGSDVNSGPPEAEMADSFAATQRLERHTSIESTNVTSSESENAQQLDGPDGDIAGLTAAALRAAIGGSMEELEAIEESAEN